MMKRAAEKDGILYVNMFGGFSMVYNGEELIDGRQSGSQFCVLMEAVLYHHSIGVSRSILKEGLFEDRDIDDVQHAIRNIIYNAKRRLKSAGLPGENYIEVNKGLYYWTDEIPLRLDTEELMRLHGEAGQESDPAKKLELLLEACRLYRGALLEQLSSSAWVVHEARQLRAVFQECVTQAADLLRAKRDFKRMKELGDQAAAADPFADWEVLTIEALSSLGRVDEAQDFCEQTIDLYIQEHGQHTSSYVRELSNRLSANLVHKHEGLDEIQDELIESDGNVRGGFYCSYPAFQEVYRILARTMDRQRDMLFIMLCTVVDSKGNPMKDGEKLDELSDRLADAIVRSIRHSDTVAKYGKGQYLVLLVNTTRENCGVVQRRVNQNFLVGRQRTGIEYSVKSVIISPLSN